MICLELPWAADKVEEIDPEVAVAAVAPKSKASCHRRLAILAHCSTWSRRCSSWGVFIDRTNCTRPNSPASTLGIIRGNLSLAIVVSQWCHERRSLTLLAKRALSPLLPSGFRISIGFSSSPKAKARRAQPHLDPPRESSASQVILQGLNAVADKNQTGSSHDQKKQEETNGHINTNLLLSPSEIRGQRLKFTTGTCGRLVCSIVY